MNPSEEALIEACKQGDLVALQALLNEPCWAPPEDPSLTSDQAKVMQEWWAYEINMCMYSAIPLTLSQGFREGFDVLLRYIHTSPSSNQEMKDFCFREVMKQNLMGNDIQWMKDLLHTVCDLGGSKQASHHIRTLIWPSMQVLHAVVMDPVLLNHNVCRTNLGMVRYLHRFSTTFDVVSPEEKQLLDEVVEHLTQTITPKELLTLMEGLSMYASRTSPEQNEQRSQVWISVFDQKDPSWQQQLFELHEQLHKQNIYYTQRIKDLPMWVSRMDKHHLSLVVSDLKTNPKKKATKKKL